jgi:hypothetical protein
MMEAREIPNAHKHSKAEGTHHGYLVEVRSSYFIPTVLAKDLVIDSVWRRWPIGAGTVPNGLNVPTGPHDHDMLVHGGLLTREAAEAHRWGLLATLDAASTLGALCIETRLVKVRYDWSYKLTEVGVSEAMSGDFFRRDSKQFVPRSPEAATEGESGEDTGRVERRAAAIRRAAGQVDEV